MIVWEYGMAGSGGRHGHRGHNLMALGTRSLDRLKDAQTAAKIGWLWALGLPYFITWFYSYSYHYRLSFAIVPLMIMPDWVILVKLRDSLQSSAVSRQTIPYQVLPLVGIVVIIALAIPGIINPLYDGNAGWTGCGRIAAWMTMPVMRPATRR